LRPHPKRKRRRYPQFKFKSTLGYPGEGPAKIVSYNIDGAKTKLASVLSEARRECVDAILLQEIHFYADGWHSNRLGLSAICNRMGWRAFSCHGNISDVKAGCAVIRSNHSRNIKLSYIIKLQNKKLPRWTIRLC
jgi:exonuclease III